MKLLRVLAVASAAFFVVPAQAQTSGTVTNHAFAIGKGAGQTGFTSLLCAATQLAVGQTSANPACKTLSGDLTMDADGVTAIGANKVTDGMLRQSGALSLIGRSANSTGNVADISAVAGSGCAFREASNVVGCGELATAALGANIVTNAKLAQMANGTTKCRTTSGTGNVEDCSASQMRTLLSLVVGTNVEAWDADLDALAALTGTGIVRRTGSATFTTGTAVANSELATMADGTIKGNVSGSSATPSDITPSQALDVIGTTRGSILYRGASGWALRAPGTSGQVLTSNGAGADPTYQDAAGGSGGSDTDRRNALLTLIYQSKSFAVYRRVVNTFATGFKGANDTDNGINTGSSSNYTVDPSGYVAPTNTTNDTLATQTFVSNNAVWAGYAVRQLVPSSSLTIDGAKVQVVLTGPTSGSGTVLASVYLGHAGTAPSFDGNQVQLTFSGSAGVTIPVGGTVTSDPVTFAFDHTKDVIVSMGVTSGDFREKTSATGFTKYQKAASASESGNTSVSGYTTVASTLFAVTKISIVTPGNMTVVTTSQTADASVSNGRVLLEYDNTATPTLDTDLTAEVTCNGGTNWASAALTAVTSYSQGGRKVAESADTACTAGTSFAARIKTLNNKSVPVYGLALSVR